MFEWRCAVAQLWQFETIFLDEIIQQNQAILLKSYNVHHFILTYCLLNCCINLISHLYIIYYNQWSSPHCTTNLLFTPSTLFVITRGFVSLHYSAMNNNILSSEWILINIAFDTLLNAAQSSKQKALKLPWAQTQISYADRVSRTGAPKYFLIVACSTFQSRCRALAMCRHFHLFQNVCFAQPLNWCYLSICECSTLTVGRGQIHCDLTQSQFFMCVHIFYIISVYIVSLTVHFLCIWISSSWIIYIYKKHEKYFKGLVIILITWCPPIGWCPRAIAQSRLWIIRPWLYEKNTVEVNGNQNCLPTFFKIDFHSMDKFFCTSQWEVFFCWVYFQISYFVFPRRRGVGMFWVNYPFKYPTRQI